MRKLSIFPLLIGLFVLPAAAQQSLGGMIDRELPQLVNTCKMLHAAPELSHYEVKTSAFLAQQLRGLGYEVTENLGKYENAQWKGHGVVAVMKNGAGPTVLVRTDMDALPVIEQTGLPYASTVKTKNDAGETVGVMHACGHDIHMTSWVGAATLLARAKGSWHGTVVFVGQPAEELVVGAEAMVKDGLFTRFPKPDFIVGIHDTQVLPPGKIGVIAGATSAASNAVDTPPQGPGGR